MSKDEETEVRRPSRQCPAGEGWSGRAGPGLEWPACTSGFLCMALPLPPAHPPALLLLPYHTELPAGHRTSPLRLPRTCARIPPVVLSTLEGSGDGFQMSFSPKFNFFFRHLEFPLSPFHPFACMQLESMQQETIQSRGRQTQLHRLHPCGNTLQSLFGQAQK